MAGTPRFLTLGRGGRDPQHLVRTGLCAGAAGDLPAIKIGGRGQWRVEVAQLEDYIQRMYDEAATSSTKHPYVEARTGREDAPEDDEPALRLSRSRSRA